MELTEILPHLPDFLHRFHSLRSEYAEEIPSFTRIYYKENLICETSNLVELSDDSSQHSEVLALAKAKELLKSRYLHDCLLLTTLEPCLMCSGSILLSRIPKVAYLLAAKQGEGISSLSLETIYSRNFFPELLLVHTPETKEAFQSFFKDKRKKEPEI
ncbi:cytidine deaminase [Leptospira perolatii]|uniref:Cytidine deaminase n=1 Tax=Leptospira perolatii TaxID=2023191 RepID=A0A2M9ZRB6_9LEPT|nr:nucleoside deaminase [Leptospira perolatii]PJZ71095.1 cytidine deaminase [Leptospira perolatii]PJZ74627.1 cytidine deaminase [Leptospira perolatii]